MISMELLNEAQVLFCAGRMEESIELLTKLLHSRFLPPIIHTIRGQAYLQIREIDKATEDFEKALQLDSTYFQAYLYRGMAALMVGKNDSAVLDFNKALDLKPGFSRALVARGTALSRLNRFDEAAADIKKIISQLRHKTLKVFIDEFELLRTEMRKILAEVSGEAPGKAIKLAQTDIEKLKKFLGEAR